MKKSVIFEAANISGQQGVFAMYTSQCLYDQAVCLRDIRKTKAYRGLGLTWAEYCTRHAGMSWRQAELMIDLAEEFGSAYFRLCSVVRVSPAFFRRIADRCTAQTIELDGQKIPISAQNAPKIRDGFSRLSKQLRRTKKEVSASAGVVELGVRVDDVLKAVTARASLGRDLPQEEAERLRALAHHAAGKWTEVIEMLRLEDSLSDAA
jgi:hypothetical protein